MDWVSFDEIKKTVSLETVIHHYGIPLRRAFIVKLHGKAGEPGKLLYPEGTACAMVLIAGDRGGASARPVFGGIAAGALYTFVGRGLRLWGDTVFWSIGALHKASIGFELSPMFLGPK